MKRGGPRGSSADRLIIGLLGVIGAHYAVSWAVPQGADGSFAVERWRAGHEAIASFATVLGAHRALYSPVFLVAVLALGALLLARAFAHTPAAQERARAGAGWSAWATPVAHLLLALVFITLGIGAMTGYSGALALPAGRTIVDGAEAYDGLVAGLWFDGAFSGASVRLEDPLLSEASVVPGATITLRANDRARTALLREGESAYLGALSVRSEAVADSALLTIEDGDGAPLGRVSVLFEPESAAEATVAPVAADLGGGVSVLIRVPVDDVSGGHTGAMSVSVAVSDGSWGPPLALELGQAAPLPDGRWLRLISSQPLAHVNLHYDATTPYRSVLVLLSLLAAAVSALSPRLARHRSPGAATPSRARVAGEVVSPADRTVREAHAGAQPDRDSWTVAVAALVITLLLVLVAGLVGPRGRTFTSEQAEYTVSSATEAYEVLRDEGIKGRILVLIDDDARIVEGVRMAEFMASLDGGDAPVTEHNFTSALVYSGIARSVYYVPPPAAWDAESLKYSSRSDALAEDSGTRVRFYGADVHLSDGEALDFGEQVIVYIGPAMEGQYDPALIRRLTDPDFADIVVRQVKP